MTSRGVKCSPASSFDCSAPIRMSSSKTIAHLHVIDAFRGKVHSCERLDDLVEQVLLGHARDLLVEREPLHDAAPVRRKPVDVAHEIGRELVWIVEQFSEVEFRQVVERAASHLLEQAAHHVVRLAFDLGVSLEHRRPGRREQTIETPQHGERQDYLAVFVALVRAAEQVEMLQMKLASWECVSAFILECAANSLCGFLSVAGESSPCRLYFTATPRDARASSPLPARGDWPCR